ncbi:MAG: metal-dependent hydrolase [Bacteroidia bacterium]|nr:metal-dependent hydrolase [Bacteroidia bacterium]
MDSLTQIVLGAAVGEVVLGRKVGNKAMLWGAIAGTIPDLDIIANFFVDDLTGNEMHRGFSHSILFSVLFAPILGWLIHRLYKNKPEATSKEWSWLAFWALFTHPLLDCHTTWGTQLLWPLPYKLAWNNIFVVDPLYTLPFLILLIIAAFYKRTSSTRRKLNWAGILVSSSYLLWTLGVKWHVHDVFTDNLEAQKIEYTRITTVPTPFNSILWLGTVETDSAYQVGLYSLLDKDKNVTFDRINHNHFLLDSLQEEDVIKRLLFLSKDWYVVKQDSTGLHYFDARFGPMYQPGEKPSFVFGYNLKEERGRLKALQHTRPTGKMSTALKELFTRMWGK